MVGNAATELFWAPLVVGSAVAMIPVTIDALTWLPLTTWLAWGIFETTVDAWFTADETTAFDVAAGSADAAELGTGYWAYGLVLFIDFHYPVSNLEQLCK